MIEKIAAVGMSGGLDSGMAAYLLQKQGYKVVGVTMSTWDESLGVTEAVKSGCFGPGEEEDIASAKRIAERLGIDLIVIDLKKEYSKTVVDYFRKEYLAGLTPNPCVLCNREMKFGLLPLKLKEAGIKFDVFATGHYVRKIRRGDAYYIAMGKDESKDQSYFLSRLSQNQIENIVFPLGDYLKSEVREIAREAGFDDLAERKESQDFLETDDFDYIFDENSAEVGDIVDSEGKVVGKHKGIIYYTVGQRRGLNLSGQPEPMYVLEINQCKNQVIVGTKNHLYHNKLVAKDVLWSDNKERKIIFNVNAKIRLHHQPAECRVIQNGEVYEVEFKEPQMAITPGQVIAFYDNDVLLGGGIITAKAIEEDNDRK